MENPRWQPSAILNQYLVILDHPRNLSADRNPLFKFSIDRISRPSFEDIVIRRFSKFGLKCPFTAQKCRFFGGGVGTIKHYRSLSRPQKGTSLCKTASYEPSCVKIGSVVFAVGDNKEKERKGKVQKVTNSLISPNRTEAPCERILTKFRKSRDMADVIICVKSKDVVEILAGSLKIACSVHGQGKWPKRL